MEKVLELFTPQPGYKILDVTAHTDGISALLSARLSEMGGRLLVAQYPGEHAPLSLYESVTLQTQQVPDYAKPFRALPRDNDIVFVRDVLHRHASPERLLKAVYTTLTNAANIVIVTETGAADPVAQLAMLEAAEYRAANVIDGVIDGAVVVMAKKMHMWGNGL